MLMEIENMQKGEHEDAPAGEQEGKCRPRVVYSLACVHMASNGDALALLVCAWPAMVMLMPGGAVGRAQLQQLKEEFYRDHAEGRGHAVWGTPAGVSFSRDTAQWVFPLRICASFSA